MKRLVTIVALLAFVVCAVQLSHLYGDPPAADTARLTQLAAAGGPQSPRPETATQVKPVELALDRSERVSFSADESSLSELTDRAREDQYRDWLLFAAASAFTTSAEEYARTFFDLPATRHGYVRPVGTFEFGETRSRVIGDGKVLGLVPAGRPAAERMDLLAHIADEQRKNQGGEFKELIVVEYEFDTRHGRAQLTRRADIAYADLFSTKYGYFERTVKTLRELQQFMGQMDDLTLARNTQDGLLLGGRKMLSRKYRSIKVEQVATVWQAEQQISQALDAFEARWKHRRYRTETEKQQILREYMEERRQLKLVNGSGFSLDPVTDYEALKEVFDRFIPTLLPPGERVTRISTALAKRDIQPFWQLVRELDDKGHSQAALAVANLEQRSAFQAARYDGPLQGTEVGMVLFYTDLLAKLWVIDFVNSSPRRGHIRGFVDDPTAPKSLVFAAESQKLSAARLWFGHSNFGFQLADNRGAVYLARNATRVYSAGSDVRRPGVEAETSVFLAASTDWWNDHYEEIARYEPEYERLNQIMKWSIVIGWLNEQNQGNKLAFLDEVKVDHSNVFPQWVRRHPELRFQEWDDVPFYPAGYKGTTTEALPRLRGPVTEGGVSLATKDIANRAPIARTVDKVALRSNLDYAASVEKNTFKTLDKTAFKVRPGEGDRISILADAKPDAKFRGPMGQLAHASIERQVALRADGVVMEMRAGGSALGELKIARSGNGFDIGWRARDLDQAHSLARSLSTARQPDLALLRDPSVEAAIKLPGEASYAVKLRGSKSWVRLAPEQEPSVDIAKGWQLRASGAEGEAVRNMQASIVDDAGLAAIMEKQTHFVLESPSADKPFLRIVADQTPAGGGVVEIDAGIVRAAAYIGTVSKRMHIVSRGEGGVADAIAIARRLGPDELNVIRKATADKTNSTLQLAGPSRADVQVAHALERRQYRKVAGEIAEDPHRVRLIIDERLKGDLKNNAEILAKRGPDEAIHDLDRLIEVYGKRPELTLRLGIAHLERGNIQAAVENAGTRVPRLTADRQAFFDEVNARLGRATDRKADLYRYAEYADWRDLRAQPRRSRDLGGTVHPVAVGDRFDFELRLSAMPHGEPVTLADLGSRNGQAIVYRQNDLALNQLDWSAATDTALRQVISGRLGKVIRLPQEDIAHFRPATIWSPDEVRLTKTPTLNSSAPARIASYHPCDPTTGLCPEQGNDQSTGQGNGGEGKRSEVYLVLANPTQTAQAR